MLMYIAQETMCTWASFSFLPFCSHKGNSCRCQCLTSAEIRKQSGQITHIQCGKGCRYYCKQQNTALEKQWKQLKKKSLGSQVLFFFLFLTTVPLFLSRAIAKTSKETFPLLAHQAHPAQQLN